MGSSKLINCGKSNTAASKEITVREIRSLGVLTSWKSYNMSVGKLFDKSQSWQQFRIAAII